MALAKPISPDMLALLASVINGSEGARLVGYKDTVGGSGETVYDILNDTINPGILDRIVLSDDGGLNVSWGTGEVQDGNTGILVETNSDNDVCTDNAVNHLVYKPGSGQDLVLQVAKANLAAGEINIGHWHCQAGDILGDPHQESILSQRESVISDSLAKIMPLIVTSGLIIFEHAGANPFDVDSTLGDYFHDGHEQHSVSAIDSTVTPIARHFLAGGAWDSDSNSQIDITQWNNGTNLEAVSPAKYYRSLFIIAPNNVIHWVYPTEEFLTVNLAINGSDPPVPPGLVGFPKSTAVIIQTGAGGFPAAGGDQWIDVRPILTASQLSIISSHLNLTEKGENTHAEIDIHIAAEAPHQGISANLTNKSGAATVVGYVYRPDPDNDNSFDYGSENEDRQVVVANSVIADDASGDMIISGYTDVYVDGVVDADISQGVKFLYFSSTNGQAKVSGERKDGCFGEATEDSSGAGLVKTLIYPRERTRKWALADEQSWRKTFVLPLVGSDTTGWVRHGSNPIIDVNNSADDQYGCFNPTVAFDNRKQKFYMVYWGAGDAGWTIRKLIAASSDDGENWDIGETIITGTEVWEKLGGSTPYTEIPSLMVDAAAGEYKLWYSGGGGAGMGLATCPLSSDPKLAASWTKHPGNPLIIGGVNNYSAENAVNKLGSLYHMISRDTSGNLQMWTAPEGVTWTFQATILSKGGGGAWDAGLVAFISLFWNQGTWYLAYSGRTGGASTPFQIGLALSTDGKTFTKFYINPQFAPSAPTAWDEHVSYPLILLLNDTFYMYYQGRKFSGDGYLRIGLAKLGPLM